MATLTNITKSTGTLTAVAKRSDGDGVVFFGWLFLFTQPSYGTGLSTVTKNTGSLTGIPKN